MEVIDTWTGSRAAALQAAMRMSNEGFASHLGVAVRTVATWHAQPKIVPRPEIQQVLDMAYERASEAVRRRFSLLSQSPSGAPRHRRSASPSSSVTRTYFSSAGEEMAHSPGSSQPEWSNPVPHQKRWRFRRLTPRPGCTVLCGTTLVAASTPQQE